MRDEPRLEQRWRVQLKMAPVQTEEVVGAEETCMSGQQHHVPKPYPKAQHECQHERYPLAQNKCSSSRDQIHGPPPP